MDSKAAREQRRGAVPTRWERQGHGSYQGLGGLGAHEAERRMGVLNGARESEYWPEEWLGMDWL